MKICFNIEMKEWFFLLCFNVEMKQRHGFCNVVLILIWSQTFCNLVLILKLSYRACNFVWIFRRSYVFYNFVYICHCWIKFDWLSQCGCKYSIINILHKLCCWDILLRLYVQPIWLQPSVANEFLNRQLTFVQRICIKIFWYSIFLAWLF